MTLARSWLAMSQPGACRLVQRKGRGAALMSDTLPPSSTPPEKTHQRARIQATAPSAPLTSPDSSGKAETLHGRGLQGGFPVFSARQSER